MNVPSLVCKKGGDFTSFFYFIINVLLLFVVDQPSACLYNLIGIFE